MNGTTAQRTFLIVLAGATLAFLWLVSPLIGSILWAIVLAMLFAPLNRRLLRALPGRRSVAAVLTLLAIIAAVVIPAGLLGSAVAREVAGMVPYLQSGDFEAAAIVLRLKAMLPPWLAHLIDADTITDVVAARRWIATNFASSLQGIAGRVLNIGQSAFGVIVQIGVMLYLTYFFLRDGEGILARVLRLVPLDAERGGALLDRFISVVHATIKGSLLVALAQGAVGGVVFWAIGVPSPLLWGVAMGFMSLLPAIGTGIIWVPTAIYLLATGAVWQGVTLVFCGLFVIGIVDNILRPILVGRDARMPDYVAFVSTLGGLELFGINGFILGPAIAGLFLAAWELHAAQMRADRTETT